MSAVSLKKGRARGLAVEGFIVLALTAAAAVAVYLFTVHPAKNSRPLGGANVDVSRASGPQTEVAVAVDSRNPQVLLAGTNDNAEFPFRADTSEDGGRTWVTSLGPPMTGGQCSRGDPAVAIDSRGREYYAFIRAQYDPSAQAGVTCPGTLTTLLQVAVRDGPRGAWQTHTVAQPHYTFSFDDKPALATTPSGRVYVAWSRLFSNRYETTVVSHSDNGGTAWSRPVVVSRRLFMPQLVTLAVEPDGALDIAGVDARYGIWITRTNDGTHFEPVRKVAAVHSSDPSGCSAAAGQPLAQQAQRCMGPNPTLVSLGDRLVLVYGDTTARRVPAVYGVVLDRGLHVVKRSSRIGLLPRDSALQFWPTAGVDSRSRTVWACYYDTSGSSNKRRAWFTCSTSKNGTSWAAPIRAASVPSLADALFQDGFSYGIYPALAVGGGVAHPMWIDTRRSASDEEIYTAAIPTGKEQRLSRSSH